MSATRAYGVTAQQYPAINPWTMGDSSEQGGPYSLHAQLLALKSSSTNLRIEALRKLQHAIEGAGTATTLQPETLI